MSPAMGRHKKDEAEKVKTFGVSLLASDIDEVIRLAKLDQRPPGWLGGKLLLRGLAAYKVDGRFEDLTTEETLHPQRIPVLPLGLKLNASERPEQKQKKKAS